MLTLRKTLKSKLEGAKRVAILGIGSDLRGDDVAGMLASSEIEKRIKKIKTPAKVRVFFGSTAPENLTGEIKRFNPTHIIMIDTAQMREKPGTILFLTPEVVSEGVIFSTHTMPAGILAKYFLDSLKCDILIVGIQPKDIKIGKKPSRAVTSAAKALAGAVVGAIRGK